MRQWMYVVGLLGVGLTLTGCGQSGPLQLTNDPHLDKRPKYLLWHRQQQQTPQNQQTNN